MRLDIVKVSHARRLCVNGQGRLLRTTAQVSLRELAETIGVDAATLARWESGATVPRAHAAMRWIDALQLLALPQGDEAA